MTSRSLSFALEVVWVGNWRILVVLRWKFSWLPHKTLQYSDDLPLRCQLIGHQFIIVPLLPPPLPLYSVGHHWSPISVHPKNRVIPQNPPLFPLPGDKNIHWSLIFSASHLGLSQNANYILFCFPWPWRLIIRHRAKKSLAELASHQIKRWNDRSLRLFFRRSSCNF